MTEQTISITVELPSKAAALALAQFVKRIGWQEIRTNAVSESETYLMRDGVDAVRHALTGAGYAPR